MSRTNTVMMTNTQAVANVTGEAVRADGWYGVGDGLHTVAIYAANLRGRVSIEASLAAVPGDGDWFPVLLDGQPHIDFPRSGATGETAVVGHTFRGNFLWLRARLDRSHLLAPEATEAEVAALGAIDRILLVR